MYKLTYRRAFFPPLVSKPGERQQHHGEHGPEVKNILGRQQVQGKLTVGPPDDRYEQEADRVADQVMRMSTPTGVVSTMNGSQTDPRLQRMCPECEQELRRQPEEDEQEELLQASPMDNGLSISPTTPLIQRLCPGCEDELRRQPVPEEEEEEEVVQASPAGGGLSVSPTMPLIQRFCPECEDEVRRQPEEEEEEELLQARPANGGLNPLSPELAETIHSLRGGRPLASSEREFFESRFDRDFSDVRVHTDAQAAQSARAINARAYTLGRNVVFGEGMYAPHSHSGRRLMAHELTHVVQQGHAGAAPPQPVSASPHVQRTLNDGHDLSSPRFSRITDLEAAYDEETVIRSGATGRGVQAIQQALYDIGYRLPRFGADGIFKTETKAAVIEYQRDHPPLAVDGAVGDETIASLDARFPTPTLPPVAARSAAWDADAPGYGCVLSLLCPMSPHTVDVLRTRITLKSFDSIVWTDEEWNGSNWVPVPFDGDGYNTGTEIGVLNSTCEGMAEILYHEVLHAEQPSSHRTTRQQEEYAYRIGEEFSIAMGLGGMPSLRSTDVEGREFADPTKVEAYVAAEYPSVPASGADEEIIGKASTHGHVEVERANGSIYTRPAAVDERVPDPNDPVTTNEVTHSTSGWTCP